MADISDMKMEFKDEPRDSQDEGGDDEVSRPLRDAIDACGPAPTSADVVDVGGDRSHEAPRR